MAIHHIAYAATFRLWPLIVLLSCGYAANLILTKLEDIPLCLYKVGVDKTREKEKMEPI
jgi:hypothetical protein